MNKALITGGAGFIGYHLCKNLLDREYEVDLLDNFSRGVEDSHLLDMSKNNKIKLINLNLTNSNSLNQLSKDYNYIYHFAAVIGVRHVLNNPYKVLSDNFTLLKNAIQIGKNQKKLKRFIFASTSEVYSGTLKKFGLEFPTTELTPLALNDLDSKRTTYMLSKIYGESMCFMSQLPVTIVRPHNFYGPRMGLSHVIPEIMKKIIENKEGTIDVFSPNHKRTFCYITDAVNMIALLAESNNAIGEYFNIGNCEEEVTMKNLANLIINLMDYDVKINLLNDTPGSPVRRLPSIEKLLSVIDYKKIYSLEKGIKETYNWYKNEIFSGKEISAI